MSMLSPPTQYQKLDTRDTTGGVTTYYSASRSYEDGKGGRAVLFTLQTDLFVMVTKAKVLFVIDLQKDETVFGYVSERIAEVVSVETLPGKPDFQEVDPGSYTQDFAFVGEMLEMQ
ncbi:MAG TPA: hypothetical protein PKE31_10515 [Pseudomonadota bacterium]|nr:hypothetical protein [Pseudomonadota bacterium]